MESVRGSAGGGRVSDGAAVDVRGLIGGARVWVSPDVRRVQWRDGGRDRSEHVDGPEAAAALLVRLGFEAIRRAGPG